jgi:hypothetical protein
MMDDSGLITGVAVTELQEECGIDIDSSELVDLTALAFSEENDGDRGGSSRGPLCEEEIGIAPSPGGCDERIRHLYLEKLVTKEELNSVNDRLAGLRDHGELITVRVVPLASLWKTSRDAKAMMYVACEYQLPTLLRSESRKALLTFLFFGVSNQNLLQLFIST